MHLSEIEKARASGHRGFRRPTQKSPAEEEERRFECLALACLTKYNLGGRGGTLIQIAVSDFGAHFDPFLRVFGERLCRIRRKNHRQSRTLLGVLRRFGSFVIVLAILPSKAVIGVKLL